MEKQFIVVVYDISNDKRRTKLHNRLKDFGTPVQYSVFECLLDQKEIKVMKAQVSKITKPRLDHVRYYQLCAACRNRVEVLGRPEITRDKEVWVI